MEEHTAWSCMKHRGTRAAGRISTAGVVAIDNSVSAVAAVQLMRRQLMLSKVDTSRSHPDDLLTMLRFCWRRLPDLSTLACWRDVFCISSVKDRHDFHPKPPIDGFRQC